MFILVGSRGFVGISKRIHLFAGYVFLSAGTDITYGVIRYRRILGLRRTMRPERLPNSERLTRDTPARHAGR